MLGGLRGAAQEGAAGGAGEGAPSSKLVTALDSADLPGAIGSTLAWRRERAQCFLVFLFCEEKKQAHCLGAQESLPFVTVGEGVSREESRPIVWAHKKVCLSLRPYLEQIPVLGGNDGVDASAEDLHPVLLDGARLPHLNAAVLRSQQQHRGERRWKMTKGSDRKSCCQRTKGREKPWKRSERQRKDSALTSAVCPPIERMMPSGFSFMISSSTCCGVTGMKYTASASPGHVKLARTLP